jgi:hypothetical protein
MDRRRKLLEELPTAIHRERPDHADVGEHPRVVVQPKQERPDGIGAALVEPVPGHDAVGRALVLDLEHHPPVLLVGPLERLGHHPVEPGPLELVEPPPRDLHVGRGRRDVDRRHGVHEGGLERGPPFDERSTREVVIAEREQVERDEMSRGGFGQHADAAVGGMDPLLERLELEPSQLSVGDHDLAVDDGSLRQVRRDRLHDLGEVAGHRPLVAAADLHLVVVAEDDRAEPVPLGLVAERAGRDLLDRLREHRGHGRHDGQTHPTILPDRRPSRPRRGAPTGC